MLLPAAEASNPIEFSLERALQRDPPVSLTPVVAVLLPTPPFVFTTAESAESTRSESRCLEPASKLDHSTVHEIAVDIVGIAPDDNQDRQNIPHNKENSVNFQINTVYPFFLEGAALINSTSCCHGHSYSEAYF